jgi:hypothetical protein
VAESGKPPDDFKHGTAPSLSIRPMHLRIPGLGPLLGWPRRL